MFRLNRLVFRSDISVGARDDFGESGVGGRRGEVRMEGSEGSVSMSLSETDFFLHNDHRCLPAFLFSSRFVFQGTESRFGMRFFDFRRSSRYCSRRAMLLRCKIIDARKLNGILSVPNPLNTKFGRRSDYGQKWKEYGDYVF